LALGNTKSSRTRVRILKAIKTDCLAAYEKADLFVRTVPGAAKTLLTVAAETNLSGYDAEFVGVLSRCVL
jgi:hypothetical protein